MIEGGDGANDGGLSVLAISAFQTLLKDYMTTKKLSLEELGTIVNDITPDPEVEAVEEQIKAFTETEVTIKLSAPLYERLRRLAEFKGLEIVEYCTSILDDSTAEQVGKATISGPSKLNGQRMTKPVTGPSFLTNKL